MPKAPAFSGHAIKPNKAQGAPRGVYRDTHSNWQQASGSPGAEDYVLAAGKGQERVKALREARWNHLSSCISHEQLCWLQWALLNETQQSQSLVWWSRPQRLPLCCEAAAGPHLSMAPIKLTLELWFLQTQAIKICASRRVCSPITELFSRKYEHW